MELRQHLLIACASILRLLSELIQNRLRFSEQTLRKMLSVGKLIDVHHRHNRQNKLYIDRLVVALTVSNLIGSRMAVQGILDLIEGTLQVF